MPADPQDQIRRLAEQETRLVFDSFTHRDAWVLGCQMVERASAMEASVIIGIQRPGLVLFRAALAGSTAENEAWLERKARTVLRFETSTALLGARFGQQGVDPETVGWFDSGRLTDAGGSFPIRVRGAGVVAAVTVSGLTSDEDHDFVVTALEQFLARS